MRRLLGRGPKVGDDVTVLAGPFAGSSGRITKRDPDGRFLVVIDECRAPLVAASDLRLVKSSSFADQLDGIHRQIDQSPDTDLTRAQGVAAQRPGANIGPPTF